MLKSFLQGFFGMIVVIYCLNAFSNGMEEAKNNSGRSNAKYSDAFILERFDPTTEMWTAAGAIADPAASRLISALPDGRVVMAYERPGGFSPTATWIDLWEPTTLKTVRLGEVKGVSPEVMFALSGSKVALFNRNMAHEGGDDSIIVDVDARTLTPLHPKPPGQVREVVRLKSGQVLVAFEEGAALWLPTGEWKAVSGPPGAIGGYWGGMAALEKGGALIVQQILQTEGKGQAFLFNPDTLKFSLEPKLSAELSKEPLDVQAVVTAKGNSVIIVQPTRALLWDLGKSQGRWFDLPVATNSGIQYLINRGQVVVLSSGKVFIASGKRPDDQAGFLIDPTNGLLTHLKPPKSARLGAVYTALPDGGVLMAGGSTVTMIGTVYSPKRFLAALVGILGVATIIHSIHLRRKPAPVLATIFGAALCCGTVWFVYGVLNAIGSGIKG